MAKAKKTGKAEWPVNPVFPSAFRPLGHALDQHRSKTARPIYCRRCGGEWEPPFGPTEPCPSANPMVDVG